MDSRFLLRRFLAFAIDWNITYLIAITLMFFGPGTNPEYFFYPSFKMVSSPGFIMGILWIPLYWLFKDCLFGRRSAGKLICGLMVQNSETHEKASYGRLILRNITFPIIPFEGFIVIFNYGKRLGDLLAKTQVVRHINNK